MYMLGSVLLRRNQAAVITTAHALLIIVLSGAASWLVAEDRTAFIERLYEPLVYTLAAVLAVATVADWWLSYKVFSRMQVINNKWINL